ncbi:hypothetical protein COL5a_008469 [Colletotrichum fioriniae]|uniref:uncharacterized protein n=1 Tax=Colletotrichum fioriniae TaxID=710243 RepID=UPI0022FFCABD|nr:uncharacterized protein COL516b_002203 [Colletotrichum fioriniae]KAJ0310402.1 hypothetical protein COL516b_002203 [Colletotrichum fioriniae]KAJ0323022.1 hypothetical protein COL5a_008469 [Colletotrichum fioriniae]KAJ3939260.1 hypothetical protein N0V96_010707 [Colletotrichum fioriniae]
MIPARSLPLRRLAAARLVPGLGATTAIPLAAARRAEGQVRWSTHNPKEGDLGGPGGQEPVPSTSSAAQSWPTLVAIAAVGLGVGSYLVHMTGKSKGQGTVMEKGEFDKLAEKVASRK